MVFYFFGGRTDKTEEPKKESQIELPKDPLEKKKLIIHCCHHKTGTVVIEKILRKVCEHYKLKYQYCPQTKLNEDTDVWMEHHSHIDFSKIDRPIIGTHMIRNPCGIIVSAYEYHKNTTEGWANRKIKTLSHMTYKEILNSINSQDGITFEMKNTLYMESSNNTIMDMYNWDYEMPNFLEVKYEDLMTNYNGTLANMFKHYGFTKEMIIKSLELASEYNIRNKNEINIQKNAHITNKNIDLDKWKTYFNNEDLINKFWKIYPENIFDKIGYPVDKIKKVDKNNKKILWNKYGGENPYL